MSRSAEIPNRFASWLYTFIDDWSVALGAIVTLTLVIAAFLAILENRNSKVLDRKERWIDEILDWAKDIPKTLFSGVSSISPRIETRLAEQGYKSLPIESVLLMDSVERDSVALDVINRLVREGHFMEVIASGIANELVSLIHAAIEHLNFRRQLISEKPMLGEERSPSLEKMREYTDAHGSMQKLIEDKTVSLSELSEADQNHVKMARNAGDIRESSDNIVKKSIELKLSLLT